MSQAKFRTPGNPGNRRRSLCRAAATGALCIAFTAQLATPSLAAPRQTNATDAATTTITVWGRSGDTSIEGDVTDFNAAQHAIKAVYTILPNAEYVTKVATAYRAHDLPDVMSFDDINAPLFAASGALDNITSQVKALPYYSALSHGQLLQGTYQGKIYAVGRDFGPSVLSWNKTLFKDAGLNPNVGPKTYAQILADAQKIQALHLTNVVGYEIPGNCGGCLAYSILPMIWASGGSIVTAPGPDQKATLDSPQTIAAFNLYKTIWDDKLTLPADESQNGDSWTTAFPAGLVGIYIGVEPGIVKGLNYGSEPIPGANSGYSTFAGGDDFGISVDSSHQSQAWAFMSFLMSAREQLHIETEGQIPVRTDLRNVNALKAVPSSVAGLEAAPYGQITDSVAASAITNDVTAPYLLAFQAIVFDNANPSAALAKADTQIDSLIKQEYTAIVG